MSSETTGCFDDGGYPVEVKVISQNGTCQFGHSVDDLIEFDLERAATVYGTSDTP